MSKKQSSSNKSLPPAPSVGPKLPAPKSTGPKLPAPKSTGPKLPKPVPTIVKPGGRGNPITAAKAGATRHPIASGQYLTASKDVKKEKKKKKKKEKQEIFIPEDGYGDLPNIPDPVFVTEPLKVPDKDALIDLTRNTSNAALIVSVLFEQLSSLELVKFTKSDTIDGINPQYSVISNIAEIKSKLDPSYLVSKQRPDVTIDNGFSIRLTDKIPSIDYLFDNNIPNYVYFDATIGDNGSLIIELDNIDTDEIVEVEIDTSGTIEEVRQ